MCEPTTTVQIPLFLSSSFTFHQYPKINQPNKKRNTKMGSCSLGTFQAIHTTLCFIRRKYHVMCEDMSNIIKGDVLKDVTSQQLQPMSKFKHKWVKKPAGESCFVGRGHLVENIMTPWAEYWTDKCNEISYWQ